MCVGSTSINYVLINCHMILAQGYLIFFNDSDIKKAISLPSGLKFWGFMGVPHTIRWFLGKFNIPVNTKLH